MTQYNAVVGATQGHFNQLAAQLHATLYPGPFQGTQEIELDGVTATIAYDIKNAPTFAFKPSSLVAEYKTNWIETLSGDDPDISPESLGLPEGADVADLIDRLETGLRASAEAAETEGVEDSNGDEDLDLAAFVDRAVDVDASFDMIVRGIEVELRIGGANPVRLDVAATLGAIARFTTDMKLVPEILVARVEIPSNPFYEALFNRLLTQKLPEINEALAEGFQLPAIEFKGARFAAPRVRVADGRVAGYAALEGSVTVPPSTITVHDDRGVFIQFDDAVADRVAAHELQNVRRSEEVTDEQEFHELGARYSIGLDQPAFQLQGHNGTLASLRAFGSGHVGIRLRLASWLPWLPWVWMGVTISATPRAHFSLRFDQRWVILSNSAVIPPLRVNLRLDPLPASDLIDLILSALLSSIAPLVTLLVHGLRIPVYYLPDVPLEIGDNQLLIDLGQTSITTFHTSDGGQDKNLCELSGVSVVRRR